MGVLESSDIGGLTAVGNADGLRLGDRAEPGLAGEAGAAGVVGDGVDDDSQASVEDGACSWSGVSEVYWMG